ncbi:alkaline phosphatase family protein [Pseudonocardia acidicola]|uniref:Phosphoesterase family protein n=1 Tax=Pseudonocardia acidicola TaxID=2724939 RepID=A0ABX1SL20_9PSEU|nr:alkaline phosphatase family protein [Pseudonocardia acidicola]NMI02277.1 hypothetical protein [Pseudonocardia acidicola]
MRGFPRRRLALVALAVAAAAVVAAGVVVAVTSGAPGPGSGAPPAPPGAAASPCGRTSTPPATYAHVIWIWDENYSIDKIIGNPAAPYINQLAVQCGLATNYSGLDHPSATDYVAATSGAIHAGQGDCVPAQCPDPDPSLFEKVSSWKSYSEGEPTNCDGGYDGNGYDVNHNPPVYYSRIRAACLTRAVPLGSPTAGELADDLARNTLPQFAFIAPNLTHDMHDGTISQGDAYLSRLIPAIVDSPAYRAGDTAVFFTYDEGETTNRLTFIAVGPSVRPATRAAQPFDHYSLLRTTQELLGVGPLLQNAAAAASMRAAFNL